MNPAIPEPVSIQVGGNVAGSIVIGDNNFVVNTNHGTIVYQQAAPQVRARQFAPQPPRAQRGFVNRTEELAKLEAWIAASEVVLLHAPDGMGKSALLKQAANSATAAAMPGGVILLESVGLDGQALGPDDVIQRLFDALFESNPPLKVDAVSARTYLSNTRPLVLMDDVVLSPALQKALPDLFPKGSILISADVPFGAFQRLSVKPLPRVESVTLLATQAQLVVNDANRATLGEICALLGDVSLALVITANVLRETHTSPEAALQAIEQFPAPERDPAQAALSRAFQFAFSRLSPGEQKVLSAAAMTPGISMTPEWLSAALGGLQVDAFIARLQALGLLFANSPRLRLPSGLRAPAQRASVLNRDVLMTRLVEFLAAPLRDNPQNWEHIRDELGNFFGALTWAVQTARPESVIALGRMLDPYLTLRGLWDAWNMSTGYVLEAARRSGQQAVEAWALHQSGVRAMGVGTRREALHFLRRALDMRRILGDTAGMAYTQHNIDLLAPPVPPSENLPGGDTLKPEPRAPQPPKSIDGGPNLFLFFGSLGAAGCLVLVALVILMTLLFPIPRLALPPTETATPSATMLFTATPTSTPTVTATSTVTPTTTLTPTLTTTVTPTSPLLGAIIFQAQPDPLATAFYSLYTIDAVEPLAKRRLPGLRRIFPNAFTRLNWADPKPVFGTPVPALHPTWSPDGRQIAFIGGGAPNATFTSYNQVYIVNTDGSNLRQLTSTAGNKLNPAWSPDGSLIAFTGYASDLSLDIYAIDINGANQANLTNSPGINEDYPAWAPDGRLIAYHTNQNNIYNYELFVMDANGANPTQLTAAQAERGDWSVQPAWSPDGRRIAFASNRTETWELYAVEMNGNDPGQITQLTDNDFEDKTPDWSPDGRFIVYSSKRDDHYQLYILAFDGLGTTLLTENRAGIDSEEPDWRPGRP